MVLRQMAVQDKTNETTAVHELLAHRVLHGRVITGDALLTRQEVARIILHVPPVATLPNLCPP